MIISMKQKKISGVALKFMVTFGFAIVMLIVSGIVSYKNMNKISNGYSKTVAGYSGQTISLYDFRNQYRDMEVKLGNVLFGADNNLSRTEAQSALTESISAMEEKFDTLSKKVTDDDIKDQLEEVENYCNEGRNYIEQMVVLVSKNKVNQAAFIYDGTYADLKNKMSGVLNDMTDDLSKLTEESGAKVDSYASVLRLETLTIVVIACVVLLIILTVFIKTVQIPIIKINDMVKRLSIGDIEVSEIKKTSNDEIGDLIDSCNSLLARVGREVGVAKKVAKGELDIEVQPQSEKDQLGYALKDMVEKNDSTLSNIRESANQVDVGSQQVAAASQSLAQGSTEQASSIEQVTASIIDITERTKTNASDAAEAEKLIRQTKVDAEDGNTEMEHMLSAMQDITESSENISKIIKTIDDIAFQTNILALNAAVEAARAGEHGKGFAVVAEEVRNLAAKSASAASETAEMIQDSIEKTHNGSEIASRTAEKLLGIAQAVDTTVSLIEQIAHASNDQANALSQVDQAIEQVSTVIQNNSATSEQCAAASEELSNQAKNLEKLIEKYKLKGYTSSANGSYMDDSFGGQMGYSAGNVTPHRIPDASEFASSSNYAENENIISLEDNGYSKY